MSAWQANFLIVGLVVLLLVSAIGVVLSRHYSRAAFVDLQAAKGARDDLSIVYGQLQLELSTWGAHGRIEQMARERLNMRRPDQDGVVLMQQR
ncbi:cell division protein FtsL [gamma proteobacterium HTCC5015]|nr:cell division protein FtsL [gamma proteobacterium HTCC5015]